MARKRWRCTAAPWRFIRKIRIYGITWDIWRFSASAGRERGSPTERRWRSIRILIWRVGIWRSWNLTLPNELPIRQALRNRDALKGVPELQDLPPGHALLDAREESV